MVKWSKSAGRSGIGQIMKLFVKYIKPYFYYYILGPVFMMVEVVGEIVLPWLLSKIINNGVAAHDVGYII